MELYRCTRDYWKLFSKYHYLDHKINPAAHTFVALLNGKVVGFCAVLHFPHPKVRNLKKIHRIVVLPDYQGIGISRFILDFLGEYYANLGFTLGLTSSSTPMLQALTKSPKWSLFRKGYVTVHSGLVDLNSTVSRKRITFSFKFIG